MVKWEVLVFLHSAHQNLRNMDKSNNQELCDIKNLIAEHFSSNPLMQCKIKTKPRSLNIATQGLRGIPLQRYA